MGDRERLVDRAVWSDQWVSARWCKPSAVDDACIPPVDNDVRAVSVDMNAVGETWQERPGAPRPHENRFRSGNQVDR
jgi:hypothetical protein